MTSTMLRSCLIAAVAAVALVSATSAKAGPEGSSFAGSWSGTWSVAEIEVDGTFDWTISDAGRISGTLYHNQVGATGTIVGHVGENGNLRFVGFAPNDVPPSQLNGFAFQGTAMIDGDGKLVVSVARADSTRFTLVAILERN